MSSNWVVLKPVENTSIPGGFMATTSPTTAGVQPDSIGTALTSINQHVNSDDDPITQLGEEAFAVTSYSSAFTAVTLISAASTDSDK